MFVLILKILKWQKSWILKLNMLINILTFFFFSPFTVFLIKSLQSSILGILVSLMDNESGWEFGEQFKFLSVLLHSFYQMSLTKTTTKVISIKFYTIILLVCMAIYNANTLISVKLIFLIILVLYSINNYWNNYARP